MNTQKNHYAMVDYILRNKKTPKTDNEICEFALTSVEISANIPRTNFTQITQKHEDVNCRYVSMYLMRKYSKTPLKKIGTYYTGRGNKPKDHATVLNGIKVVDNHIYSRDKLKIKDGGDSFMDRLLVESESRVMEFVK